MLDRKFIVENADRVKQNCAQRGVKCDFDRLVELEMARRQKLGLVEDLNRQANEVAKTIGKAKDAAEREARKEEGRRLREQITGLEQAMNATLAELDVIHRGIPNMTHPDAPIGGDAGANAEIRRGKTP